MHLMTPRGVGAGTGILGLGTWEASGQIKEAGQDTEFLI